MNLEGYEQELLDRKKRLRGSARKCYLCERALFSSKDGELIPCNFVREAIERGLSPFRVPDCGPPLQQMFEIAKQRFPAYEYADSREDFSSFWKAVVLLFEGDWWLCKSCAKVVLSWQRRGREAEE